LAQALGKQIGICGGKHPSAGQAGGRARQGQADGKDPAIKGENYVDLSQLRAILPE
jgi:hypothetical protein